MGGLAVAARLARWVTRSPSASRPRTRRQARRVPPGRVHLRHRPVAAHPAGGLPRPVRQDRRAARGRRRAGRRSTRPCRYRFADGTWLDVPNAAAPRFARAMDAALGAGAGHDWDRAPGPGRASLADHPRSPSWSRRCAGRVDPARLARRTGRRRGGRTVAVPARAGPAPCATPGCGCCWTATRPTPAPTRAGPRPRWPRCRTRSSRSAPGTCRGGLATAGRGAARAALSRGRVGAHRRRRDRDPRRRRAGGRGAAGRRRADPRRRGGRPMWTPLTLRGPAADPAPLAAARRATPPRRFRAAAGLRGPHAWPGAPHGVLPAATTTPSSTRSSAARPGRSPTRRSTSPCPTTRRAPGRARGVVRAGQRASARRRAEVRSTGARPGWPTAYADRVLTCSPSAASTSATGCCCARSGRRRPGARDRRPGGAIYGTARVRAALLRPANASRCPGCSWSAGPPTRAAGCRWSALSAAHRRRPDRSRLSVGVSPACGQPQGCSPTSRCGAASSPPSWLRRSRGRASAAGCRRARRTVPPPSARRRAPGGSRPAPSPPAERCRGSASTATSSPAATPALARFSAPMPSISNRPPITATVLRKPCPLIRTATGGRLPWSRADDGLRRNLDPRRRLAAALDHCPEGRGGRSAAQVHLPLRCSGG